MFLNMRFSSLSPNTTFTSPLNLCLILPALENFKHRFTLLDTNQSDQTGWSQVTNAPSTQSTDVQVQKATISNGHLSQSLGGSSKFQATPTPPITRQARHEDANEVPLEGELSSGQPHSSPQGEQLDFGNSAKVPRGGRYSSTQEIHYSWQIR